jgi:hypothetical protein
MRVGLVALLVVGCSSSSSSGPKLADDARAGVVLSVTGEVTATLAGDSRVLVVDGPVFAGDTVATPADGAVAIELAHNGAVLSLGGDKRVVLRQHAAWRVAPKKGGALDRASDEQTAVAGRHAERSSADTRATAAETTTETASEDPRADEEPDTAATEYRMTGDDEKRAAESVERERLAKEAARQQAREAELKAEQARLEAEMQKARAEMEKARAEAERAAAKDRLRKLREKRRRPPKGDKTDDGKPKVVIKCDPNDPLCDIDGDDGGGGGDGEAPDRLTPALDGVDLASCKPHGAGKVTLRISLAADGKLSVAVEKATTDALGNCVAGLVRALELGAGDARTVTRTFEVR